MLKIKIRDPRGTLINLFLIAIIWYTEVFAFMINGGTWILLALGVLLVLSVGFDVGSRRNILVMKHISKPCWIILSYIILSIILGCISSANVSVHISEGLSMIEYSVVMIAIIYIGITRKTINGLIWNMLIMCTYICLSFLINPQLVVEGIGFARYSFLGMNPNGLSFLLAIGIWSALYFVSIEKINIFVGAGISGLFLLAVFFTGSKTGILCSGFAIVFWFISCYLVDKRNLEINRLLRNVFIIIIVAVASYYLLLPKLIDTATFSRLLSLTTDSSGQIRLGMYQRGLEYFLKRPFLRYGFNGFASMYGLYSHSTWIEVFVSSGVVLAILYFSSYVSIWNRLRRIIRDSKNDTDIALANKKRQIAKATRVLFGIILLSTISVVHIYDFTSYYVFGILLAIVSAESIKEV